MKTARLFPNHFNKLVFRGDRLSELYLVSRAFHCLNYGFFLILELERHEGGFDLIEPFNENRACVQKAYVNL